MTSKKKKKKGNSDDSGDENWTISLFQTNYCRFPLTVCDMQTASIPHGPAVVIDDKGGDEDELEQEGWTGAREVKEVLHQLETIRMDRMEVQQARGVGRNPPASGK